MPSRAHACVVALTVLLASACKGDADKPASGPSERSPDASERPRDNVPKDADAAAGLVRPDGTIYAETELMGTRVSINLWVGDGEPLAASEAITAAIDEIARIEQIASEWRESSDLSRINRSVGEPVAVPPELIEILTRASKISADTNGLFDVSFYAVGQLWRFEPGARPPSPEAIAAHLPSVDWRAIELDPETNSVRLAKPGMKIGLGAIAKGYAVDQAAAILHMRGFGNHIVEAGGDTQVSGRKGDQPWRVGVQDPKRTAGRIGHIVAGEHEAIVTSGNYARFFEWEGTRYTHILDPRTGWPIVAGKTPKSVTLVAANATDADAYCTAVSVMPPDDGLAFVEARPGLEAVIIAADDRLLVSTGLRDRFVDEREPGQP